MESGRMKRSGMRIAVKPLPVPVPAPVATPKLDIAIVAGAALVFGLSISLLAVIITHLLAMWGWL